MVEKCEAGLRTQGMQNLSAVFLTGAYTRLWNGWGWKQVAPGYDKLYFIRKGSFFFEIDGKKMEGHPGQIFLLPYNSVQDLSCLQRSGR